MFRKLIYSICLIFVIGLFSTNAAIAADPNLVGWWKFDGNANDASGNGLNGTEFGGPDYVAGPTYGDDLSFYPDDIAINLAGLTDALSSENPYVELPSEVGSVISSLMDCTFTIWVNFRTIGGTYKFTPIFEFGTGTTNYMYLRPRNSSSPPMAFGIVAGGTTQAVNWTNNTLPAYSWHHVAVTIDDVNNIFRLYVDGVERAVNNTTATYAPIDLGVTTLNYLGKPISSGQHYFVGYLDDFRIYNKTLSVAELQQAMGYPIATFPTPTDGTILPVGATAVDLTWARGNNAAAVNGSRLYLSGNLDEVSEGAAAADKGLITGSSYTATDLVQDVIYYWRVDTIAVDGTAYQGDIWNFRLQPRIAWIPTPSDRTMYISPKMTLKWSSGSGAVLGHNVYLSDNFDQVNNAPVGSTAAPFKQFLTPTDSPSWKPDPLEANKTYYWRVDEVESDTVIHKGQVWRFTTVPNASPINDPNLVGWWTLDGDVIDSSLGCDGTEVGDPIYDAGFFSSSIYLDNDDNADASDDIYATIPVGSIISMLTNSTFAIWVNWEGTEGSRRHQRFFSFGTGPGNYMQFGPRISSSTPTHFAINTADEDEFFIGYGGNSAHSGSVISTNDWHHLAVTLNADDDIFLLYLNGQQVGQLNNATVTPSDLGVTTNNWIGRSEDPVSQRQYRGYLDDFRIYDKVLTADEIQQLLVRLTANVISPRHRAENTTDMPTLKWEAGDRAAQHDVYFGTDQTAVTEATTTTAGIYRGRQTLDSTSYTPTEVPLTWGQTYYWRIDEIEADGTMHVGNVWSFTAADFVVVDDFETYNDIDNKIYETWSDYYANNTGMTVGHFEPPFAERTIVNGGRQAMYMRYDNDGTVNEGTNYEQSGTLTYSEAEREWQVPQDWTSNGVNTLSLWFRGLLPSFGSLTEGAQTYTITARGTGITGASDQFHFAYQRLSGVGSITAKVVSMTNTGTAAKAGVMIRETLEPGSAHAMVVIQSSSGITFQDRPSTSAALATVATEAGITVPYWVRLSRSGNTLTGERSPDGSNWETMGTANVLMQADVYVGLCLTSGNADATCTAEFSNVDTDGTVTGPWQSQDIGIASNTPEGLYVVLEDNAGNSAVIKHSDPNATTLDTWTQWTIPLADLTGVNPQAIKKMIIGVGDRTNPQLGGAGDLYIDDIGVYPPPSEE